MTDQPDLRRALDLAASGDRAMVSPETDLARARAAAQARSRRRLRTGLAAVVVVVVGGIGVASLVQRQADERETTTPQDVLTEPITLVAMPLDAAPYTFDLTPQGWSVQAQKPTAVTIAPDDDSTSSDPDDFEGKLVITFDDNPLAGARVEHEGRTFWVIGDSGHTTMSAPTGPGEPSGVVRIQYPDNSGWDRHTMMRFLASVHVGDDAQPSVG